jgi:parallel beta-helix repeat protein
LDWTSPSNATGNTTSTSAFIDINGNGYVSSNLQLTNFGFTTADVPSGSTINGVTVEVELLMEDTGVRENLVQLTKNGSTGVGDNNSTASSYTSKQIVTYGGTLDNWSASLTAADVVSSNFGVLLNYQRNGGGPKVQVDVYRVRMTIEYTPSSGITVGGTIYTDDGTSALDCTTSRTVALKINGTGTDTVECSNSPSNGSYEFTNVSVSATDILTVYLSGESEKAVAVTESDGSSNITDMDLHQDTVIVRHDNAGSLTIDDMDNWDGGDDGDVQFTATSGSPDTLLVDSGVELHVWTADTFAPGGNVTTQGAAGHLHIDDSGVFTGAGGEDHTVAGDVVIDASSTLTAPSTEDDGTITIGGSFTNDAAGVFTAGSGEVIFTATTGTETIDSQTDSFYDLTLGETSGSATWNLSSALDVNGNMVMDYGTLDMNGSNNITLAQDLTINGNGNYTKGSGTFTFDGTGTSTWTNASTTDDLGDVVINGTTKTIDLGSSVKATSVDVQGSQTLGLGSSGYEVELTGSGTGSSRPFIVSGTLTEGTDSKVLYSGTSALEVEEETYHDLELSPSGAGSPTYTLGTTTSQTMDVDGDMVIGDGTNAVTVDAETSYDPAVDLEGSFTINANGTYSASSTSAFNIAGSWSNSGTFTDNSSTITFDSTSTGRTISGNLNGSSEFYKVNFNGAGGGWTVQDAMKVSAANATDTLLVTQGTVTLGNGDGDDLEVNGKMVVGSATGAATFQTVDSLPQGSEIIIDVNNNASPTSCTNCEIEVGTATDGDPQGTFTLNENAVLRLNSAASVESNLTVLASGKINILGSQDESFTSTEGTDETRVCLTGASWNADEHNGKHIRVDDTFANTTANGDIYEILDTTTSDGSCTGSAPSLLLEDNDSADELDTSVGTIANALVTVTLNSVNLVTADDEHIGRYLHNITDGEYYRIVDSANNGATGDTITIVDGVPDAISGMTSGDDVEIVDVSSDVVAGIGFEVIDYATVTGAAGAACTANNTSVFHGYIRGEDQSETIIQYADICDMGADTITTEFGVSFGAVENVDANEGMTIIKSRIYEGGHRGIYSSGSSRTSSIISGNRVYRHGGTGIYLNGETYTISNNVSFDLGGDGIFVTKDNNTLDSNISFAADTGIDLATNSNNEVLSNVIFATSVNGIEIDIGVANIFDSNVIYAIAGSGIDVEVAAGTVGNVISSNTIHSNTGHGMNMTDSSDNVFYENNVYGNDNYGMLLTDNARAIMVGDDFGVSAANSTGDIGFSNSTGASEAYLHGVNLGSTTEVTGVYIVRRP